MCFRLLIPNELNSRYNFAYNEGYKDYLINTYNDIIAPNNSWAGTAGPKAASGCRMCFRLLVPNELNSRYSFAYNEGYKVYLINTYNDIIASNNSWAGTAGLKAASGAECVFGYSFIMNGTRDTISHIMRNTQCFSYERIYL